MILGSGSLAQSLKCSDILCDSDTIYVAAGVSNSKEIDESQFVRERNFISNVSACNISKRIVYFSTFYLNNDMLSDTHYAKNKFWVENHFIQNNPNAIIIRLPNLVVNQKKVKVNENTLIPYFLNCIINDEPLTILSESKRYFLHSDDLCKALEESELDNFSKTTSGSIYDFVCSEPTAIKNFYCELKNNMNKPMHEAKFISGGGSHRIINSIYPYALKIKFYESEIMKKVFFE